MLPPGAPSSEASRALAVAVTLHALCLLLAAATPSPAHNTFKSKSVDGLTRFQDDTTTTATTTADALTTRCSSCMLRESLRNISLAAIKEEILSKLGMKHAPNMTGVRYPKVPQLKQLFNNIKLGSGTNAASSESHDMQADEPFSSSSSFKPGPIVQDEEDDFHARTERIIAIAQQGQKMRHGRMLFTFRFSEKVLRNQVVSARLWMFVRGRDGPRNDSRPIITVTPWRVLQANPKESLVTEVAEKSAKHEEPGGKGGWVHVDVQHVVSHWFSNPRQNLGVVINAVDQYNRTAIICDPLEEDGALAPFIEVFTKDVRKHRSKRTIGLNCAESSEETRCCRYPLTVDFEEFGWDWIIAPKKYEANYCSGECPYVFLQKYPHTHIVHLANPSGTVGPCCAPRKMSAISMLYFDTEYNIIYGLLPGMVVDRCGCS